MPKRWIGCANRGQRAFGETDNNISPTRVSLEARILDATGDKPAAQVLRWRCFEAKLSADILRDYLRQLSDFEDVEAENRAHAVALATAEPELALQFFLDWPRLDLAANLIVMHPNRWNGGDWHILPKSRPFWSTIIRWQQRYSTGHFWTTSWIARAPRLTGHGAKYLGKLALLAEETDPTCSGKLVDHTTYLARLKKAHPRKSGFWTRVD